jgi:Putative zinc-finger
MRCEKTQEFFSDYIGGTLERPMMVAVEAHLKECGACADDVAALRQTWAALDALPMVEPPADFAWRVATRLQHERLERREKQRLRSGFWPSWVRALTPAHAVGLTAIAALLAVGLMYPLQMNTAHVPFGPTGREPGPSVGTPPLPPPQADPTLAPQVVVRPVQFESGQWMGSVVVTPAADLPQFTVSVTPMSLLDDRRLAGAERLDLAAGTMHARVPYVIPVPLGPDASEVQAVTLQITSPALPRDVRKVIFFPIPGSMVPRSLVTLDLPETDVYVLLSRLTAAIQRPIVADTGLRGSVSLHVRNATPEHVLNEIVAPLGGHWYPASGGYTVTNR